MLGGEALPSSLAREPFGLLTRLFGASNERYIHKLGYLRSNDLTKPYSVIVDSTGKRFVNEAGSYMALGQAISDW